MSILTITNLTFREAWRKKIFWLALVLGVAFLILFAIGFHFILIEVTQNSRSAVTRGTAFVNILSNEVTGVFLILGLFAINSLGIQGGILQMVNHGISTGALFLVVGMLYERRHTRDMDEFGGLWKIMPIYGALTLIVALSSMGLPGLNGFVGEFTILLGAWQAGGIEGVLQTNWFAALAALGVILAAVYILFMFQKLFLGPLRKDENRNLLDLNWREIITLVPLIVLIFWIGLYPQPFFNLMAASVDQLVVSLETAQSVAVAGLP